MFNDNWIFFGLLFIGFIIAIIYEQLPNKIEFTDQPIPYETINTSLKFNENDIPKIITNEPKENILYQTLFDRFSGFVGEVTYKQINKTNKRIKLKKKLPIKASDLEKIKSYDFLTDSNSPLYELPKNKKTPGGTSLIIYSKINSINLDLTKGYYSLEITDIDKVGLFVQLLIYDKKHKLLYIARFRYFPFQ